MSSDGPLDGWLTPSALAGLTALGDDADFAEGVAELRELLSDDDFRQELDALVLLAVRSPDELEDAIEAVVTMQTVFYGAASTALDLAEFVMFLVAGRVVQRGLRAGGN
jgi:uncharacterized protein with PhoU and TrkA domain